MKLKGFSLDGTGLKTVLDLSTQTFGTLKHQE